MIFPTNPILIPMAAESPRSHHARPCGGGREALRRFGFGASVAGGRPFGVSASAIMRLEGAPEAILLRRFGVSASALRWREGGPSAFWLRRAGGPSAAHTREPWALMEREHGRAS